MRPPIGSQWVRFGVVVTVVPTGRRVPDNEVNVMHPTGSIQTVTIETLTPKDNAEMVEDSPNP